MRPAGRSRLAAFAVSLSTVLFLAWSARFLARASMRAIDGRRYFALFDDALVSMRYAWNLSHGHGLVWNPGERVEGYSNLLTTLVMSVVTGLFDRRLAALAIQVIGVATVLAAAALAHRLARFATAGDSEAVRRALPPIAFAATLACYPLAYWSFMGMETGLMTLLLLASLVAVERWALGGGRGALIAVAVTCGLASLGRPDGILFAALVLPAFAHAARTRAAPMRALALTLGVAALALAFPVAQLAFRLAYYGAALPHLRAQARGRPARRAGGERDRLPSSAVPAAPHALRCVAGGALPASRPRRRGRALNTRGARRLPDRRGRRSLALLADRHPRPARPSLSRGHRRRAAAATRGVVVRDRRWPCGSIERSRDHDGAAPTSTKRTAST
jgi:hypothetical protein